MTNVLNKYIESWSIQEMPNCFGLVQNVTISSNHISRASTVQKFGCTLKSGINFNSRDSCSSTLAFPKRTKALSNLLKEL